MSSEEISMEEEGIIENPTVAEEAEEEPEVKKTYEPKRAKVIYDYEARESDELSLNKGEVLTVLEEGEDGWWKGDLNGKIGSIPANHVKLIEVQNPPNEDGEDDENSEGKKKKTLNKYGVKPGGLGSLFSGGVPTLKKRSQPTPESPPVSEEKHAMASVPTLRKTSIPSPVSQQSSSPLPHLPPKKKPPKPKKVEPKAEVIHEYIADGDDEISLIPGTHVTILEKIDDDGWWSGRNQQGQTGLFPSTYVKEIKQQSVPEEVIESNIEETESSEVPVTVQAESITSEPAPISDDSPIHLSSQDTYDHAEDSPTLPKSPPPPMRRTTNETSSPPAPRRSTSESSQSATPQRRSTYESSSPTSPTSSRKDSSHDGEEYVTSKRPPSIVSPDLPIQSNSPNSPTVANVDATPVSPEERPTVPPRQSSGSSSIHENKTDSPKSPTLAKPPTIPKVFSPAKPPVIPPLKRSSSKSDKSKNETLPTETVSPKIDRRASYDQHDSSTELENQDDNNIENEEQVDEIVKEREETIVEKVEEEMEGSEEIEISEEAKSDKEIITENIENVETKDEDTTGSQEVESEEKKSQPQLPPLPTGPKLSNLGKDRPVIRNRKTPSAKSIKETASQSQTATLLEAVASAKDEDEPKSQPVASPPTPPKPEKPAKPNMFKLPTPGASVQLRHVAKKPPVETSTESTETTTSSNKSSGIDTKPITGGVKGISSRFNQFSGIPNSSDVEFRLKKWFNEEINKVKSQFEAQLAEERSKREALEEEFRELVASLQE